jgi:hypothetical protein
VVILLLMEQLEDESERGALGEKERAWCYRFYRYVRNESNDTGRERERTYI